MFERPDSAQPWAEGIRFPFSSSPTVTSVARSSLGINSFNLKPVADNRSSSKAACTRKREVGR